MTSSIVIKDIQLQVCCGVTAKERSQPQPILVDLRVRCQNQQAFQSDRLSDTLDYAAIIQTVHDTIQDQQYVLLEKLTEHLCQALFQQFPLTQLTMWVRKICAPIQNFSGSVGIRVSRSRLDFQQMAHGSPAPFLIRTVSQLPQGKVLDVATGRGRHAYFLATQGFSVHGIDRNHEALSFLDQQARAAGNLPITTEFLDLETDSLHPPDLGTATYDVIIVFFYLYRPLIPQLKKALKSGGVMLYETFLLENHLKRNHPRRKEFCLESNELLALFRDFQVLHYDEGDHRQSSQSDRSLTARFMARKK